MMREIEFRGFSVGDGTDTVRLTGPDGAVETYRGRWLTGSLVRWADGDTSLLRSDPDDDNDHLSQYFVLPETGGEWTGYTDKNGRRIYEGDRVRVPGGIWDDGQEVSYAAMDKGCWVLKPERLGWDFMAGYDREVEVIGTVYDPEVTGAAE